MSEHLNQLIKLKGAADELYYQYEYRDASTIQELSNSLIDIINIMKCLTTSLLVEAYKNEPADNR